MLCIWDGSYVSYLQSDQPQSRFHLDLAILAINPVPQGRFHHAETQFNTLTYILQLTQSLKSGFADDLSHVRRLAINPVPQVRFRQLKSNWLLNQN